VRYTTDYKAVGDIYNSQGVNDADISWKRGLVPGQSTITVALPDAMAPLVLREGEHYYILKSR
jgi:hypothetical protein